MSADARRIQPTSSPGSRPTTSRALRRTVAASRMLGLSEQLPEPVTSLSIPGQLFRAIHTTHPPPARYFHSVIADSAGIAVLFGGFDGTSALNDLWLLDLSTGQWTASAASAAASGPTPRYGHTAVAWGSQMVVFAGASHEGDIFNDIFLLNSATASWSSPRTSGTPPCARKGHAAALVDDVMYVFGGSDGEQVLNDMWELNLTTWTWKESPRSLRMPSARCYHTMSVYHKSIYLYGGSEDGEAFLEETDLFEFTTASSEWRLVSITNTLQAHCAHVFGDSLFVIGKGVTSRANEIFEFQFFDRCWLTATLPDSAGFTFFPQCCAFNDSLYMFCGLADSGEPSSAAQMLALQPDSREAEMEEENRLSSLSRDRWEATAMQLHPELVELRERLRPIHRVRSYAEHYWVAKLEKDAESATAAAAATATAAATGNASPPSGTHGANAAAHSGARSNNERVTSSGAAGSTNSGGSLSTNSGGSLSTNSGGSLSPSAHASEGGGSAAGGADSAGSAKPKAGMLVRYPGLTESRDAISHQLVLELVMEHLLMVEQYNRTVAAIAEDANLAPCVTSQPNPESRLAMLLRLARRRVPRHHTNLLEDNLEIGKPTMTTAIVDELPFVDHLPGRDTDEEQDINVWDEAADSPMNIVRSGNEIKAASLNKLIEQLVPESKPLDLSFLKTFITVYSSFCTPIKLFNKLNQRYNPPPNIGLSAPEITAIRKRVCDVIRMWLEKSYSDFNERLLSLLNQFVEDMSREEPALAKMLRTSLAKPSKTKIITEEERKQLFSRPPPDPRVPVNIFSKKLLLTDIDEEELANQLTYMEFEMFAKVFPTDFLNRGWLATHSKHQSVHLKAWLAHGRRIENMIAVNILQPDNKKKRIAFLETFLRVANFLRGLNNFQTMICILNGINHKAVLSLKGTLSELPQKSKELLSELNRYNGNSNVIREAIARGKTPMIPHADSVLSELCELETFMPDNQYAPLINWTRAAESARAITRFLSNQSHPFNLQPVIQIQDLLTSGTSMSDDELMKLAAQREP